MEIRIVGTVKELNLIKQIISRNTELLEISSDSGIMCSQNKERYNNQDKRVRYLVVDLKV